MGAMSELHRQQQEFSAEPPVLDMDAKEFGFLISEAVSDCNDVDGVAWTAVARQVAEAAGIFLTEGRR